MDRNRDVLENNPRIGRAYAAWDRMSAEKRSDYLQSAEAVLDALEPAARDWARADGEPHAPAHGR